LRLAYLVNRNGIRVIRWPALCLFLIVATVIQFSAAAVFSLVMVGDFRLAWFALPICLLFTGGIVVRSFRLPVDELSKDA
jgi:hypothetical protein